MRPAAGGGPRPDLLPAPLVSLLSIASAGLHPAQGSWAASWQMSSAYALWPAAPFLGAGLRQVLSGRVFLPVLLLEEQELGTFGQETV